MLGSLPRVGRCTGGEGTSVRTEQEPGLAANSVGAALPVFEPWFA